MHSKSAWVAISVGLFATGAFAALNVPLTISDRAGAGQVNAFVCSGLPVARGQLAGSDVKLTDSAGKTIPAFIRPLEFWDDGSVKWLQVQSAVSLGNGAKSDLKLSAGRGTIPAEPWQVKETTNTIAVDNGLVAIELGRNGTELIRSLTVRKAAYFKADGEPQTLFTAEQRDASKSLPMDEENWLAAATPGATIATAPGSVEACYIDEKTPFRIVICQEGSYTAPDGYRMGSFVVRFYLYRDSAEVKVEHTVVLEADVLSYFMRGVTLRFPGAFAGCQADFSQAAIGARAVPKNGSFSIVATKPDAFVHQVKREEVKPVSVWLDATTDGKRTKIADARGEAGWVTVRSGRSAFAFAIQRFRQRFPKEIEVSAKGLVAHLWPVSVNQKLDGRNPMWNHVKKGPEGNRYASGVNGRAEGTAMTERMFFDFSGMTTGDQLAARKSRTLLLKAAPDYYVGTGVFGPIGVRNPARFPEYEGVLDAAIAWIIRSPDEYQWYGILNDGGNLMEFNWAEVRGWPQINNTWMCRGYSGWDMDDGGFSWMILQAFLRSGIDEYFDFAERSMNYALDVSSIHTDTEPGVYAGNNGRPCVGGSRRHNEVPWGDYVCSRGANAYGKYFYYLLTGEPRYLDVIIEGLYFEWIHWSYENWTMVGSLSLGHELMEGLKKSDPYYDAKRAIRIARHQRIKAWAQQRKWAKTAQGAQEYVNIENAMANPDALLNRATEHLKGKISATALDFVGEIPMLEGVKYYELAQAPDSPGAQYARNFIKTCADETMAGRAIKDQYAPLFQGRAMVMAHAMKPDRKYADYVRARLDEMFPLQSLKPVSLSGDMKGGALKLDYMDLWSRIARYDSIPFQKLEHIFGRIVGRMPYFLHCLDTPPAVL